jgi:uncharacterized protein (TIGR03118 family)
MGQRKLNACKVAAIGFSVLLTLGLPRVTPARAGTFAISNLITDDQKANKAQITDADLKNAWGISHSGGSPFWVSDNGRGLTTLYTVDPTTNATARVTVGGGFVTIPPPPPGMGNPTGQVFNTQSATSFKGNIFLFVSEDGTVSGWSGSIGLGNTAVILQSPSTDNVYKGTTLVTIGGHTYLLSANFRSGNIDVLKGDIGAPDLAGKFTDPNLPAGFAPFNVQTFGNHVFVTYALQDAMKHDDVKGPGNGYVTEFNLDGTLVQRIGTQGTLNSPWGMAIAPASFGKFAGDLLVGNFGDGAINVFDTSKTNGFVDQIKDANGTPITIDGLWGLSVGNDVSAGSSQKVYFSAGPMDESHGVFGVLQVVPEPSSVVLGAIALGLVAARWRWSNRTRHPLN